MTALEMMDTILDIVQRLHGEGLGLLLVEQNAQLALEISDRAYVLDTGRIGIAADARKLLDNPGSRRPI